MLISRLFLAYIINISLTLFVSTKTFIKIERLFLVFEPKATMQIFTDRVQVDFLVVWSLFYYLSDCIMLRIFTIVVLCIFAWFQYQCCLLLLFLFVALFQHTNIYRWRIYELMLLVEYLHNCIMLWIAFSVFLSV